MAIEERPVVFDDDNPEWTEEDFARARSISDFPELMQALTKAKAGRPAGSSKEQVSLRLDRDVVERFRAGGPGWQTRMNKALRKAAGF